MPYAEHGYFLAICRMKEDFAIQASHALSHVPPQDRLTSIGPKRSEIYVGTQTNAHKHAPGGFLGQPEGNQSTVLVVLVLCQ